MNFQNEQQLVYLSPFDFLGMLNIKHVSLMSWPITGIREGRLIWNTLYIPNFNFLAQFGGELCRGPNSKNGRNEKTRPKNHGEIGLKSWDSQKAYLELLLNVHTKFQLPSPIWRRDRGGTGLIWDQKGGNSIFSLLIDLGG